MSNNAFTNTVSLSCFIIHIQTVQDYDKTLRVFLMLDARSSLYFLWVFLISKVILKFSNELSGLEKNWLS